MLRRSISWNCYMLQLVPHYHVTQQLVPRYVTRQLVLWAGVKSVMARPRSSCSELHPVSAPASYTLSQDKRATLCLRTSELHSVSGQVSNTLSHDQRATLCLRTSEQHSVLGPASYTLSQDKRATLCLMTSELHSVSGQASNTLSQDQQATLSRD